MFKKNNQKETKKTNAPSFVDESVEVSIKNSKGKKTKTTNVETKVIENKKTKVLEYGDRNIKDIIAVDIDRTNEEFMKIGNKYVKSFIITGYPSTVSVGWLGDLYNFDGDIDVNLHVEQSDERGAIDQLTYKITQFEVELDIQRKRGNIRNITALTDKITSLIQQRRGLEQNFESLFYIQVVANLYANSIEELRKQSQKLIGKLKGKRITINEMYLRQEDSYKSALPVGESFVKDGFRNGDTGMTQATINYDRGEISHKDGVWVGLNMATATPSFLDFYDTKVLNNSNGFVFGSSGSGKTFFISLLTIRSTIKGIKTVIIDPEGEFVRLTEEVGGSNITLKQGAATGINPFDVEEEEDYDKMLQKHVIRVDIKSKIADLLNLIAVMVGGLTNEGKALVAHVIGETYKDYGMNEDANSLYEVGSFFDEETGELIKKRKKEMPTLTAFRNNLIKFQKSSETQMEILSPIINTLSMFCKGGVYDMFDRQTSPELRNFVNAPIVNFDVSSLEESILRPIGMYVALSWTWEKFAKKNPLVKKRILIDEAWMFLNKNMAGNEFTGQFLENTARRIRKRNGGLIVASQNFTEFSDNPQGRAVLTNSSVRMFLKQNATDIDALQNTFKLSDGERGFLLTAKKGEMLIKIDEESSLSYAYATEYERKLIERTKKEK